MTYFLNAVFLFCAYMASKDESLSCIRKISSLRIHFPVGFLLNLGVIRTGMSA